MTTINSNQRLLDSKSHLEAIETNKDNPHILEDFVQENNMCNPFKPGGSPQIIRCCDFKGALEPIPVFLKVWDFEIRNLHSNFLFKNEHF